MSTHLFGTLLGWQFLYIYNISANVLLVLLVGKCFCNSWCGCFIGLRFKLTIFKFRYLLWKFWSRDWQCLRGNQHMAITVMNFCQVKFPKKFSINSKIWYGTKFPKSDTVQNLGSTCSDLISHKAWRQSLEEVTKLSIEVINIIHQLWVFRLHQRCSNRADLWQLAKTCAWSEH